MDSLKIRDRSLRGRRRRGAPRPARAIPLIGAHMSIAGGLHLAVERGARLGCAAIQIFTTNATRWRERTPDEGSRELFVGALKRWPVWPVFSHAGYLINLASPDDALRRRSVAALIGEVERCRALGLPWVVLHPGSHGGAGEEAGLALAAASLREALSGTPGAAVRILLENTAGQGNTLGHAFEQLARLLEEGGGAERLGICFDTAHAFAAGYDLRTPGAYRKTVRLLDGMVGLGRVLVIHVNDSKKGLGSRVDRHEHIGRGSIGLEAFRLIMRDRRFRDAPKILETPKQTGKVFMDPVNLRLLRKLAG